MDLRTKVMEYILLLSRRKIWVVPFLEDIETQLPLHAISDHISKWRNCTYQTMKLVICTDIGKVATINELCLCLSGKRLAGFVKLFAASVEVHSCRILACDKGIGISLVRPLAQHQIVPGFILLCRRRSRVCTVSAVICGMLVIDFIFYGGLSRG